MREETLLPLTPCQVQTYKYLERKDLVRVTGRNPYTPESMVMRVIYGWMGLTIIGYHRSHFLITVV